MMSSALCRSTLALNVMVRCMGGSRCAARARVSRAITAVSMTVVARSAPSTSSAFVICSSFVELSPLSRIIRFAWGILHIAFLFAGSVSSAAASMSFGPTGQSLRNWQFLHCHRCGYITLPSFALPPMLAILRRSSGVRSCSGTRLLWPSFMGVASP